MKIEITISKRVNETTFLEVENIEEFNKIMHEKRFWNELDRQGNDWENYKEGDVRIKARSEEGFLIGFYGDDELW